MLMFLDHPELDTDILDRTTPNQWPAGRIEHYLYNTLQTQKTNVHAFNGVRTRDHRNKTAAELQLRTHSQLVRRSHIAFCHYICGNTLT
jgi:hypothetical protein